MIIIKFILHCCTVKNIMSHRPAPPPPAFHSNRMEPLILMSGFLTKRTKTMSRWKKRWWQLLGDGSLLYFKGEARVRVLGEIDVAHTCYDIRLGAEHCHIKFPRLVNPSTCFSFAVLKRTYYVYAPSPHEARQWADALTNASYVLNRDRPRSLSCSPAIQVARAVGSNLVEDTEHYPMRHSSGYSLQASSSHDLWIDGSPHQVKHTPSPNLHNTGGKVVLRPRAMSQCNLISPAQTNSPALPASRHMSLSQTALSRPSWGLRDDELDLIPEREESWEGGSVPLRRKHQLLSLHSAGWDASCERLEMLQQKEDAIKLRLEQLQQQSLQYRRPLSPHLEDAEVSLSQPTYSTPLTTRSDDQQEHSMSSSSSPAARNTRSLQLLASSSPTVNRIAAKKKLKQRKATPAANCVKISTVPEIRRAEIEDLTDEESFKEDFPSLPPPPPPPPPPLLPSSSGTAKKVHKRNDGCPIRRQTSGYWGLEGEKSSVTRGHDASVWVEGEVKKVSENRMYCTF